jgi:hypothetical protein
MVERQLPKLDTRVRFPSSAQTQKDPDTQKIYGGTNEIMKELVSRTI